MMATDKPRFSLTLDEDTFSRVIDYQNTAGLSTKSRAIQALVEIGLEDYAGTANEAKNNTSPNDSEAQMIAKRYAGLDDTGKGAVRAILDYEETRIKSANNNKIVDIADSRPDMIKKYCTPAAAGYTSPIEGEDYEMIPRPKGAPKDADYCVTVSGDSMEPYINDGQIVYVKRDEPLKFFDVGLFYYDGDVYVKQWCIDMIGTLHLLSANPHREDANKQIKAESTSTVVCLGKVILKKRLPQPEYFR